MFENILLTCIELQEEVSIHCAQINWFSYIFSLWWNESKIWETYQIQHTIQYSIESKVNACRCVNLIRWCGWVWNFKWGFLKFDCFLLVIFLSKQKLCSIVERKIIDVLILEFGCGWVWNINRGMWVGVEI